ncbi:MULTISPECIES: hypothetical protein [Streptomyces]|uniref:hypothetical protein n=1 Tax=Streptomyces TaxID=1883 RepID=UPI00399CE50F
MPSDGGRVGLIRWFRIAVRRNAGASLLTALLLAFAAWALWPLIGLLLASL